MSVRHSSSFLTLAVLLAATSAAAQQRSDTTTPDDVIVTGRQAPDLASAGTKSALPLAETAQSITVVTGDQIEALGLQNLNQALRFVAGITPETRGSSAEVYDQFKLRGFDAPVFLDGLKQFGSTTGYAIPQVDVSRLARFEVLKGPASTLYGQSSPGGLIAQSSKLPVDLPLYGSVAGTYGEYNLYRVDADVGGSTSDVLWRVYGSANGSDTQQRFARRERQTVSGAVTIGNGSRTTFTLLGTYSHDPHNGAYGVFPALGTLVDNPNGKLSTRFDGGEAGNRYQREQAAGTYIFTHDFGGGWRFRSSGRYQNVTAQLGLVYVSGTPVAGSTRVYNRASYATDEELNNWTYDNQLAGTVRTGPVTHRLLFGVDRQVAHSTEDGKFGTATPLDVYNPVYGTMTVPRAPTQVPGEGVPFNLTARLRQHGIYAQDQMELGALRVTLGGRQDWAWGQQNGGTPKKDDRFTWRAAALYTLPFGLAPYVSYSTSFEPQSSTVRRGDGTLGIADPSFGKQIEAGAKFSVPGTPILLSGAWFRIDQTNVVTSTPDFSISRQTGEVRSTGVEFEGSAPLGLGFTARAAYSRQRVRVTSDPQDPSRVGRGLETVGRGGASLILDWAPERGTFQGFALGGAVRHVDEVYAGVYTPPENPAAAAPLNSPSYTVYDAWARFDLERLSPSLKGLTASVNASNLFDKTYITSCFANYAWCWYGNRRVVQGTIAYRF